jgi:hypothetical protein
MRKNKGFAMGLFLVILVVLTSTVVMLLESSKNESKIAFQQEQLAKARLLGKSSIDNFFSRLNNINDYPGLINENSIIDVYNKSAIAQSNSNKWYKYYSSNVVTSSSSISMPIAIECGLDDTEICYQLYISPNKDLWNNKEICLDTDTACLDRKQRVVSVTSKVRYDCKGLAPNVNFSTNCKILNIDQRLRKWQFQDFSFFSQYNVISPGFSDEYNWLFPNRLSVNSGVDLCAKSDSKRTPSITDINTRESLCPSVNYTYFDVISGDIYSNDDFINVCGNYKSIFIDNLYVFTKGKSTGVKNTCPTSASQNVRAEFLPSPQIVDIKSPLNIPSGKISFDKAKKSNIGIHLCGNAVLEINGNTLFYEYTTAINAGLSKTGTCPGRESDGSAIINNSLITVDGNAYFTGAGNDGDGDNDSLLDGRLTVYVKNVTKINQNIIYTDKSRSVTGDVLGINSGKDIIILSNKITNCSSLSDAEKNSLDIYVDAILISLEGTVYSGNLAGNESEFIDQSNDECPNKLVFYGSMATRYQGAFGIYDAQNGFPLSGFIKIFSFDNRGKKDPNFIPPYITTPTGAVWNRIDINEEYSK